MPLTPVSDYKPFFVTWELSPCVILRFACFSRIHIAALAATAQDAEEHFLRGYYLQQQGQRQAALDEYRSALDAEESGEVRGRVLEQLDKMSDAVVADDMAQLMPPETIAYVALAQPGEQIEKLAKVMGLTGRHAELTDSERVVLPLDDGLEISSDFQMSPSLLAELKKISGVAIAITGVDLKEEHPEGVLVIHAGDSDLVRGMIDTGVQVVPRQESIGGCETFCIEGAVWFVKKGSLIIGSDSRQQIIETLQRMEGGKPSLAEQPRFQKEKADREDALLFACLDGRALMKHPGPHLDDASAVARIVLGLDRIQHVTAVIRATESGVAAQLRCRFDEGYQGLAYGLIKTSPLKDEVLQRIPSGAAVVAALGVNPQLASMARASSSNEQLSGMDVGRELFVNIKDIGMFVLPAIVAGADEVPEFGFVISANDANKSERLWNQLLSWPSQLADESITMRKIDIDGRDAQQYTFEDENAPELVVLRLDDTAMLVGTEGAVRLGAATAEGRHPSIEQDDELAKLISQRSEHTAKAVFVHVGRAIKLGALLDGVDANDADEMAEIQRLCQVMGATRVIVTSDEGPAEFKLRLEAMGLPLFEEIIKSVAAHANEELSKGAVAFED